MKIAFQGSAGSYSDLAVRNKFPGEETVPFLYFEKVIEAVKSRVVDFALLPAENSLQGRIPSIHLLLPDSDLSIVGETFQRVEHCLLATKDATLDTVKFVHSQDVALNQVRHIIEQLDLVEVLEVDTALSAKKIVELNDTAHAAIASELAAQIYDLKVLIKNAEDESHNTTRFYVVSTEPCHPDISNETCMTTLVFKVRNRNAALFNALLGFATNGINMTKLESYMLNGKFTATQFLCEVEGHVEQPQMQAALSDLYHHAEGVQILGVYPRDTYRDEAE